VALLFAAAIPHADMPAPWALWLIPLVPLAGAAGCVLMLRSQPSGWSSQTLREQFAADAALWREINPR